MSRALASCCGPALRAPARTAASRGSAPAPAAHRALAAAARRAPQPSARTASAQASAHRQTRFRLAAVEAEGERTAKALNRPFLEYRVASAPLLFLGTTALGTVRAL